MSLKVQKPSWQVLWAPLKKEIAHWDIVKKVLQTIWENLYAPSPLNGNAYDKVSANAASSFPKCYKKSDRMHVAGPQYTKLNVRQTNSFQNTCDML